MTAPSSRGKVQKFLMNSCSAAVKKMAPSSRGKVQKFLMNSCFAAVKETAPSSRGQVQKVPDEFLICCRVEVGSVVTWEGSEAPDVVSLLQC